MRNIVIVLLLLLFSSASTAMGEPCKCKSGICKSWKMPPRAPIVSSRAIREVARPVDRDPDNRLEDLEERLDRLEKDVEKTLQLLVQMVQKMNQEPTNPQPRQSVLTPLNQASP